MLRQRENGYSTVQRTLVYYQAAVDVLYLVSSWLMFSLPEVSADYKTLILPHLMPHLFPLMNILLTGGLLNLLCLCLDVQRAKSDGGAWFALARYLLPSAIFSLVSNIPKFLLMKTVLHEGMWVVAPTSLRISSDHVYVILSNTATTGLIPLLAWVAFISTSIKKSSNTAIFHSSLFGLFCLCHLMRISLNIYEVSQVLTTGIHQMKYLFLVELSHFLLILNSSLNVCIITAMDKTTRVYLKRIFKRNEDEETSDSHYSLLVLDAKSVDN